MPQIFSTPVTENIQTAKLVKTWTAGADYDQLLLRILLSGLVGNGTYQACATIQEFGSGTVQQSPTSSDYCAAGVFTWWLPSLVFPIKTGDILKVYVQGLAGDVAVAVETALWNVVSSGGAGTDPLLNPVPSGYAEGTAGYALGRLGSGLITTVSPVSISGDAIIYAGDDYFSTDGRSLEWSTSDSATWPDLTGASITMYSVMTRGGTVVTPTGATKKVRIELSKTDTKVNPQRYPMVVVATLSDGHTVTLITAQLIVRNKQSLVAG